jgi:hypothetical protein
MQRDWTGSLIDVREWAAFATVEGLRVEALTQSSRLLVAHFERLGRAARRGRVRIPARELRSWQAAVEAAESRLIAYFTLIARA